MNADFRLLQVGEAQTGYAGDAGNDSGVEGGKFSLPWNETCWILMLDYRKDTAVDGRSGRNELRHSQDCIWGQTSSWWPICTNNILDMECMGKGVTTLALWCICTPPLLAFKKMKLTTFEEPSCSKPHYEDTEIVPFIIIYCIATTDLLAL